MLKIRRGGTYRWQKNLARRVSPRNRPQVLPNERAVKVPVGKAAGLSPGWVKKRFRPIHPHTPVAHNHKKIHGASLST